MQKYSIFSLIKNAFSNHKNWEVAWKDPEPKKEYDVINSYAKEKGIEWYASAWDLESQKFLKQFDLNYNKK